MTKTNAIFLILLIMPAFLCYTNPSILSMIEKAPEGKELMNSIYLQVRLKGDNLDQGCIQTILEFAKNTADQEERAIKAQLHIDHEDCIKDLESFSKKVTDNQKFEFTIGRHVSNNKRALNSVDALINRATNEKNDYEDLQKIIGISWENWKKFQKSDLEEFAKVRDLLDQARKALKKLSATHDSKESLIQLSDKSEYFTNLNEIKLNFQSTFVQLQGFRPIITKLFELISKVPVVSKDAIRLKISRIMRKIREQLKDMEDEILAAQERQDAIFNAILEGYKENISRISRVLERLEKERAEHALKAADLLNTFKDSKTITGLSTKLFKFRKDSCIESVKKAGKDSLNNAKIRNIVAQIGEIISEKFGSLKTYFLQRDVSFIQIKE